MKTFSVLIALIIWMTFSLLLVGSVVGLVLFVRSDSSCKYWHAESGRSTWSTIGIGLYKKLIE